MTRLLRSFGYALTGLRYAFQTQANLRIHVAISLVVIALGLGVQLGPIEWTRSNKHTGVRHLPVRMVARR